MKELHLIVDWMKTFDENEMIEYMNQFDIDLCEILHVPKLRNKTKTMSEFYKYPVDDDRGTIDFMVYLVKCDKKYEYRKTAKGNRLVSANMFDIKMVLRENDSAIIHTTDNIHETKHALSVLKLYEKYVSHHLKMID
jgi:hypothetical protein